jgi:hypothetical protein
MEALFLLVHLAIFILEVGEGTLRGIPHPQNLICDMVQPVCPLFGEGLTRLIGVG